VPLDQELLASDDTQQHCRRVPIGATLGHLATNWERCVPRTRT